MFSNISIRAKITAVVALLLVALAGMGLVAVMKMRAINESTVQIATSWLPSVRVLGELRTGVITYRNVLREHMLSETLEEKLAVEKRLAGVVESNTQIRHAYEPLITSPEERALYEEQGAATQEISRNVQQAVRGTEQVSANITDVQRGASETGSASAQVLTAARSLSGDSNRLRVEVSKFLTSVRAA